MKKTATSYPDLLTALRAIVQDERDFIANAANCAALLFHGLRDVSWAGFYLTQGKDLVLGPFQGKPACVRIAWGRGVCGTAAQSRQPMIVPDVTAFAGHIACDALSRSEIVVPLLSSKRVIGVLDLDSHKLSRFDETDLRGLTAVANLLIKASAVPKTVSAGNSPRTVNRPRSRASSGHADI